MVTEKDTIRCESVFNELFDEFQNTTEVYFRQFEECRNEVSNKMYDIVLKMKFLCLEYAVECR